MLHFFTISVSALSFFMLSFLGHWNGTGLKCKALILQTKLEWNFRLFTYFNLVLPLVNCHLN